MLLIVLQIIFILIASSDSTNEDGVCVGSNIGLSSSRDDYYRWKAHFSGCVYVDGNIELNNFDPSNKSDDELDKEFDLSFFDDIKEITGYLLIHNNRFRTLQFKNLQIIRGRNLIFANYSLFVSNNPRLKQLDLRNLTEIQRGRAFIQNNPNLCHMNEINWQQILKDKNDALVSSNADPALCEKCSCCPANSSEPCSCWLPNVCQKLTKVNCHEKCGGQRCYGSGVHDCCSAQCAGGCYGPKSTDCVVCRNLIIKETGECVETCPRITIPDPITGDLILNKNGMYLHGTVCVRKCPSRLFVYNEFCLNKCPSDTYESEELDYNSETGEKAIKRVCRSCTNQKCQKSCSVEGELNVSNIKNLENCEVLNSNLIITRPYQMPKNKKLPPELEEKDFDKLKSLRIVNGFVKIQSNELENLSFLSNLEIIRANIELLHKKYALVILGAKLKTLGLNKLKSVERGSILLQGERLCLHDTINWTLIANRKDSYRITAENTKENCIKENYVCDQACSGCWSVGPKSCQLCKAYKLEDFCVETCENKYLNERYIYLNNTDNRECGYCHSECKFGCYGPTEFECKECSNYILPINETYNKCVDKCPISHYSGQNKTCMPCYKDCYGCTGPKNYITEGGCTKCSSALVSNDPAYSIIKCIEKDSFECTNDKFSVLVPENLKFHPLKGKTVCRKCNDECDECFNNGVKLNTQCKKCKNFYSNSTGECVKNCTSHNEYQDHNKKFCLACNSECRLGCSGSSSFECNQCRTYKVSLEDLERVLLDRINSDLAMNGETTYDNLNEQILNKYYNVFNDNQSDVSFNDMIKHYMEYLDKQKQNVTNHESIVTFCVPDCPAYLPFKTSDYFCTDNLKATSIVISPEWKVVLSFISVGLAIMSTVFILFLIHLRYKLKMQKLNRKNEEKFFNYGFDDKNEYDDGKKVDMSDLRTVNANQLINEKMLGKGAFGTVYRGYYMPFENKNYKIRVAIKVLNKAKLTDPKAIANLPNELLNEAKVMASVDHEYCLRLTGICLAEPMMLITQLMKYGSVVTFFQKYRDQVTELMLLTWAKQIAQGMAYLEERGIVHRDLAARNILVHKFNHIKITDFGLARVLDSNEEGIYVRESSLVPFKWLAIESIKKRLFNHKSDVWSYGICLWEIFTFCSKPYAEYPDTEPLTIYNSIQKGTRLAKPEMASLDVYIILLRCWLAEPEARPNFKLLANEFDKMCLNPKKYLSIQSVDFNNPFKTIEENTDDLLKIFKQDTFDEERQTNNESISEFSTDKNNDKLVNDDDIDSELGSLNGADADLSATNLNNLNNVITFKRKPNLTAKQINEKRAGEPGDANKSKNVNLIKKFLGGFKKFESQMSTGTASTYLSYSCSSDSNSSPKLDEKTNKKKIKSSNLYEEQEGLLGTDNNNRSNLYDYSLSTSRSNSNNSSRSTNSTSSDQLKPNYKLQRYHSRNSETTNKTNSDYLEPIMSNVMQNLEYFDETNQKHLLPQTQIASKPLLPPPKIIITPENAKSLPNRNYYNDNIGIELDNKRQTLI